jgi:NAD(P)-dependent dehydrogenase (short-subunit alcohol dehydrogenase family)
VQADLADAAAVERLIPEAVGLLGPVTLLVNNASEFEPDEIGGLDLARWSGTSR